MDYRSDYRCLPYSIHFSEFMLISVFFRVTQKWLATVTRRPKHFKMFDIVGVGVGVGVEPVSQSCAVAEWHPRSQGLFPTPRMER